MLCRRNPGTYRVCLNVYSVEDHILTGSERPRGGCEQELRPGHVVHRIVPRRLKGGSGLAGSRAGFMAPPCKERRIRGGIHDLFLQPIECPLSFAIHRRYVDAEYPHKAVRFVLQSRRLALRCPGYSLCDADARDILV